MEMTTSYTDRYHVSRSLDMMFMSGLPYAAMCRALERGIWNRHLQRYDGMWLLALSRRLCRDRYIAVMQKLDGMNSTNGSIDIVRSVGSDNKVVCTILCEVRNVATNRLFFGETCRDHVVGVGGVRPRTAGEDIDVYFAASPYLVLGDVIRVSEIVLDRDPALFSERNKRSLGRILDKRHCLHFAQYDIYGLWCWWPRCHVRCHQGRLCNLHRAEITELLSSETATCRDTQILIELFVSGPGQPITGA